MIDIENARTEIDEAIVKWLLVNGVSMERIDAIDYSFLDDELNALLEGDEDEKTN